ncbi:probable arginine--tRNA ligase, mitochondrial [Pecten maximus]|uniref:probable arginine--tRNA ligase, mitochondrial n=1 Tax=Pecten maximus TaxID=6579 RepID=UPI0014591709|nr:probable arginine--tRNA ligase, mitochondrial [Pecten maximus]
MVREQKERYGTVTLSEDTDKQRVLIEYSSPNIAKPFHAGHFRSTILGNIIANLNEACGHTVFRINYLGDWGIQYGLMVHHLKKNGSEAILDRKSVKYMLELYINANEEKEVERSLPEDEKITTMESQKIFKKLEEGDPEELRLWRKCRDLSVEHYLETYKKLGIQFTAIEGESMYLTQTKQLLEDLKQKGMLKFRSETGVGYMKLKPDGLVEEAVLVRSNGTSLYLTRDVAAALDRHKRYQFDRCHYVVEQGQYLHFKQLGRILKELDVEWAKRYEDTLHIGFGRIAGMSTRKGSIVLLSQLLLDVKKVIIENMEKSETTKVEGDEKDRAADILTMTTLVFWDLKKPKKRDYIFNWNELIKKGAMDGSLIHYCHSRLCSLLSIYYKPEMDEGEIDLSLLTEREAVNLINKMIEYENVVEAAVLSEDPFEIAQFLNSFRNQINSALKTLQVKDKDPDIARARLQLFKCCRTVYANGLQLLGITPLEKM